MDNKEVGKEVFEEAIRESLISISHSAPARKKAAAASGLDLQNGVKGVGDGNGDDKYRSKLISISFSNSPDAKV